MAKKKTKSSPYIIRFFIGEDSQGTYRVSKELFLSVQKDLKSYRCIPNKPKKVRCIETGEIFKCARDANIWLVEMGKTDNYVGYNYIKDVCYGRKEKMYGYHWEFVK